MQSAHRACSGVSSAFVRSVEKGGVMSGKTIGSSEAQAARVIGLLNTWKILRAMFFVIVAVVSEAETLERTIDPACSPPADQIDLRLKLVSFTKVASLRSAAVIEEIDRIWSRQRVRLSWEILVAGGIVPNPFDVDLWVHLLDTQEYRFPQRVAPPILGTVRFVDGRPLRVIRVSVGAVLGLLQRELPLSSHKFYQGLDAHIHRLERAVARTAAHELGHVLLRSSNHSRTGLMRARIPARELMGDADAPFGLEGYQASQLQRQLVARRDDCASFVGTK